MSEEIEVGDHVRHEPTGEEWIVRRVAGEHLEPAGYPPTRALVSDCRLMEKAVGVEFLKGAQS